MSQRSQVSGGGGDSQMEVHEGSQSIVMLVQNSAACLENEITKFEVEYELKMRNLKILKENCRRQADNNDKQRKELEHMKVKVKNEDVNREFRLAKKFTSREKCQKAEKYFTDWSQDVNLILPCIEEVKQHSKNIKLKLEYENDIYNKMNIDKRLCNDQADKYITNLRGYKDRLRNQFDGIKGQLSQQIIVRKGQKMEQEQKLSLLEAMVQEKTTIINNLLFPQNSQLENTLETLKQDLANEMEITKSMTDELQSSVKELIQNGETLSENVEVTKQMITETNISLRDKEMEIKVLENKQKQLMLEEEENAKICHTEMTMVTNLCSKTESMKEEYHKLSNIDKDSSSLKFKLENLKQIHEDYKRNISDVENVEKCNSDEFKEINKAVEELQHERKILNTRQSDIREQIKELQNKINHGLSEHEKLRLEIDLPYTDLVGKEECCTKYLKEHTKLMAEVTDEKVKLQNAIKNIKEEQQLVKALSQESDFKLFSYAEECKMLIKDLKEHNLLLSVSIANSKQAYIQAQSDMKLNEELKEKITFLESDLETQQDNNAHSVVVLKESHKQEIEARSGQMADMRVQYEKEFRNKVQIKSDASRDVKENRARIIELHQQEALIEEEIRRTQNNLVKCNNLVHSLEHKLSVVAHVATVASQSIADPTSQLSNLLNTDVVKKRETSKSSIIFPSPGSDSSGLTYNPDEKSVMKVMRKRVHQQLKTKLSKTNIEQTKLVKKDFTMEKDDWDF